MAPVSSAPNRSSEAAEKSPYRMTLSLNVLNHLGINLYSNVPAVISEAVANAWDADATEVDIKVDTERSRIVITDNGHGMTRDEVNSKYLHVGYQRRADSPTTPVFRRRVMGRKGIGKLSLFSIAEVIDVFTIKANQRSGLRLDMASIKKRITENAGVYNPEPLDHEFPTDLKKGTRIILTGLRRRIGQTEKHLRRRLARRFSVIGARYKFSVVLNGKKVEPRDRGYFDKIQYLWYYGERGAEFKALCSNAQEISDRSGQVEVRREDESGTDKFAIDGWIGTVFKSTDLKEEATDLEPGQKENLNRVVLMVRGKMAQEDVLRDLNEGRLVSKYIIGELHADFLDLDDRPDIATSSRQDIVEDDPRYGAVLAFLKKELSFVAASWEDNRAHEGAVKALEIPVVKAWFDDLDKREQSHARSLFGKINKIPVESAEDRKRLFQHAILAFESMRFRDALDRLEQIAPEDLAAVAEVFSNLADLESGLYYQIAHERVGVINVIRKKVDSRDLDRVLAEHLHNNLWLLDPSWDRATEQPAYSKKLQAEFNKLRPRGRDGAVRLQYSLASGKHLVIDLRGWEEAVETIDILDEGQKLRSVVRRILREAGQVNPPIEIVVVVGEEPSDWGEDKGRMESENILREKNVRLITYRDLLKGAHHAYREFIDRSTKASRVQNILQAIDKSTVYG